MCGLIKFFMYLHMKLVHFGVWLCELKKMFAPGFHIVSNMVHNIFFMYLLGLELTSTS